MANPSDHVTAIPPAVAGNGHVATEADAASVSRRPPGPSAKPAAVVLGIIFVLFVIGIVAAGLTGSTATKPPAAPRSAVVPGTGGLVAVSAREVLSPILTTGEPPADVVAAVVVPRGTSVVPGTAAAHGVGLFDSTVGTQVPTAEAATIVFFRAELAAGRWHLLRSGPSGTGGYQFLAQHPGSDGYEWEIGITLAATRFSSAVPAVTAPPTGVTPVTVRLFAVSDQS